MEEGMFIVFSRRSPSNSLEVDPTSEISSGYEEFVAQAKADALKISGYAEVYVAKITNSFVRDYDLR